MSLKQLKLTDAQIELSTRGQPLRGSMEIRNFPLIGRILYLALLALLGESTNASLVVSNFNIKSGAAVVRLECYNKAEKSRFLSLGGVLNTQTDAISDIVLVAAHALSSKLDQCVVSFKDQQLDIARAEMGLGTDASGDWAVLTLDGRFTGPVNRLEWYGDSATSWETFALNGGRVSVLKFLNGDSGKSCDVRIPKGGLVDPNDGDAVIVSDCISMPGMSGAPALVEVEGVPTIIGLNIGTRHAIGGASDLWRSRVSVIRLVDTKVEEAIDRAISRERR